MNEDRLYTHAFAFLVSLFLEVAIYTIFPTLSFEGRRGKGRMCV